MPTTTDLLPSVTVCGMLCIERSTLSKWVTAGKIQPAMQLPGRTGAMLFDPVDVAALVPR